jgi:farnesyl-diphosphate farnesyltransferase
MNKTSIITENGGFESRILHQVSRSFALTIPQLPEELIKPVTNAYLICRIVDTIEDEASLPLDRKQSFFRQFIEVVNGKLAPHLFAERLFPLLSEGTLPAERELVRNTPIVMKTFFSLDDRQRAAIGRCAETMAYGMLGFQKIQNPHGLETLTQMNDYCYYVAGVVGEMLTELFCSYSGAIERQRHEMMRLAASFGQGLQMTNILKDLWDDKERGACWLPNDVFREAGFDLAGLRSGHYDQNFGEGLESLVGVAHGHLKNALAYTQLFPRHETGIRKFCMWSIGLAIYTLKNINHSRDFSSGRDVKISRGKTRNIIMLSNACIRSDLLLQWFFKIAARGLPIPEKRVTTSAPELAQSSRSVPADSQAEPPLSRVV